MLNDDTLRTSDVAAAVGVHPNTVRLYEEWGYLPAIPRAPNGYRQFRRAHVDQMRLARLALQWPYPGGKAVVVDLVVSAAGGDFVRALDLAYGFLASVQAERAHAEAAVDVLERWAGTPLVLAHARTCPPHTVKKAPPSSYENREAVLNGGPDGLKAHRGVLADRESLLIGEAAERLNVTRDKLRNWERNGLLAVPRDPENGYRRYGAAELGRARVIRALRQAGYSTMAILRMLLAFDAEGDADLRATLDTPRPDEDVVTVADRWLSTLAEVEDRAHAVIRLVTAMMG